MTRDVFFTKIYAATLEHYDGEERQRRIKKLQPGQSLLLVRNHTVSGFNTAVKVCLHSGDVLGYLPPEFADGIANLMDQGKAISTVVKEIRSGLGEEPWECLIEMKVLDMVKATGEPAMPKQPENKLIPDISQGEEETFVVPRDISLNFDTTASTDSTETRDPKNKPSAGDFFLSLFFKFCITVVLLLLVFTSLYFLTIPKPLAAPPPEAVKEQKKVEVDRTEAIEAFSMAKRYVKDRLIAPYTAKFPWYSDDFVNERENDRWVVISYVDSQNAFGAMLRTPFIVELTYGGNHNWRLEDIVLLDPVLFMNN